MGEGEKKTPDLNKNKIEVNAILSIALSRPKKTFHV
jgi:hypothetical protein